ncbi:MAG: TIR domain-containing protein, partial [Propionicimonas sp.]
SEMLKDPFTAGMELIAQAQQLRSSDVLGATAKAYRALHLFEEVPTRRGMGLARLLLGEFSLFTSNLDESRDHLIAARDFFAEIPLRELEAQARRLLGEAFIRCDDLAAARAEFEVALQILSSGEDESALAEMHRRFGSLERRCGNVDAAVREYDTAIRAYERLGDLEGMAGVLLSCGNTLAAVGMDPEAMELYESSMALFETMGDRLGQANAERFFAAAARRRGKIIVALEYFRKALNGYTEVGDLLGESYVRQALGEIAATTGDAEAARLELRESIELFARNCDPVGVAEAVSTLAETYLKDGDEPAALHAMSWGIAEGREAARWAVSAKQRRRGPELIADLESRALELALKLGEGAGSDKGIEGGRAGFLSLLRILLDAPESADPKVEALRGRIRQLAGSLESNPVIDPVETRRQATPEDPHEPVGEPASGDSTEPSETRGADVQGLGKREGGVDRHEESPGAPGDRPAAVHAEVGPQASAASIAEGTYRPGGGFAEDPARGAPSGQDPASEGPAVATSTAREKRTMFLSHSSQDRQRALDLADHLQADGRWRVWMSETAIGVGRNFAQEIFRSIRDCDAVVVLVSRAALASEYIRREVGLAIDNNRPLLPVTLEPGLIESRDLPDDWRFWLHTAQSIYWTDPATVADQILSTDPPIGLGWSR